MQIQVKVMTWTMAWLIMAVVLAWVFQKISSNLHEFIQNNTKNKQTDISDSEYVSWICYSHRAHYTLCVPSMNGCTEILEVNLISLAKELNLGRRLRLQQDHNPKQSQNNLTRPCMAKQISCLESYWTFIEDFQIKNSSEGPSLLWGTEDDFAKRNGPQPKHNAAET